ncbi:hypothetical protein HELRODRAFT_135208, partial [Helobdella robusta]|uniref:Uncharacterized protein n=1 Tax=Helobdella robusta TaxID=6412 RepID=T1EI73_HELRO
TSYDYQFRFVIVGDSTVGKSSLLKYFICAKFDELAEPTVGVDFFIRTIDVEPGVRIKLQLWDTAGQERFKSITASYFRNCAGVLLVFDITNRSSFSHIPDWMNNCRLHSTFTKTTFLLVGHKADLEATRQVTSREATLFADFHDMLYLETSSVDGCNVDEAFRLLTEQVYAI